MRALRQAAECGSLPVDCGKAWLDAGIYEDEVFVKLFVPLPKWLEPQSRIQMAGHARSLQEKVVVFLKQFPDFVGAEVTQTGELGVRDGGRIRGEYTLTREDVLEGRKFDHAVCRCCWPIEYWDPERGVSLEYLPAGACYEIPRSCLKVHGIDNLWAAGKCLSADRYAQSSARVVGACWAMGEAAGKAAANYVIESSRASAKGQVDNFSQTGKLTSATL